MHVTIIVWFVPTKNLICVFIKHLTQKSLFQICSCIFCCTLQEPFDSFSKDLLSTLHEEQEEELLSYLKTIDIPPFLNLFYEFIETTVQHYESHDIKIDWS